MWICFWVMPRDSEEKLREKLPHRLANIPVEAALIVYQERDTVGSFLHRLNALFTERVLEYWIYNAF